MIPNEPTWRYWLRRIDVPVQLGRLAVLLLIWWLWWSETIWDGWDSLSIFGIHPLPNVPPTFRAAPGGAWDYLTASFREKLFWEDLWVTVKEALVGFVIASALAIGSAASEAIVFSYSDRVAQEKLGFWREQLA